MAAANQPPAPSWRRLPQDRPTADRMARSANDELSGVVREEPLPCSPEGELDLVLARIAQHPGELTELERYESLYLESRKEFAVLRQKLRRLAAGNQLGDLCLPVGGILIGLTASLFDGGRWILGLIMLLTGIALIGGRLWLKYRRRAA